MVLDLGVGSPKQGAQNRVDAQVVYVQLKKEMSSGS